MANVNPEPSTVDEQMDRSIGGEPPELNLAELLQPPRQRSVIRNRELQLEKLGQRPASESQTVRLPRIWSPASYSGQFPIRYRDLAYLYWLRFGYFIYLNSGSRESSQ